MCSSSSRLVLPALGSSVSSLRRETSQVERVFKNHYCQTSKGKGMAETNFVSLGFPAV